MGKNTCKMVVNNHEIFVSSSAEGVDVRVDGRLIVVIDPYYLREDSDPADLAQHRGPLVVLYGNENGDPVAHVYYRSDGRITIHPECAALKGPPQAILDKIENDDCPIYFQGDAGAAPW